MFKYSILFSLFAIAACSSTKNASMNSNSEGSAKDGWVSLFDGKTTNGWHSYGKSSAGKAWKVQDGTLMLDIASKKEMPSEGGDLVTNEEYENYHLKIEWKISPKGNSGIIFNVNEDAAKYPNTYNTGPEMQVLDNGSPVLLGHADAKLFTHRAGDLYDLLASQEAVKPAGEWNTAEIVSNKGKLDFYLNGKHTLSTTMWDDNWRKMISISKFREMAGFGTYKKGKIALQDHGDQVWYRNIMIKKL
jgi:hypothetical protein